MRRKIEEVVTQKWARTIITCDLCGFETEPGGDWPSSKAWERNTTEIEARIGDFFPDDGDFRTVYRLDVCPTCFIDKFKPGVEKLFNVKFEEDESV